MYELETPSVELSGVDQADLWIAGILCFGVGDLLTTVAGLQVAGVIEGNAVPALLVERYGVGALFGLKLIGLGACYVLWRVSPRPYNLGIPLGLALLGAVVTLWNVRVLLAVSLL